MAVYRKININYWHDSFILGLPQVEKFFYLYLMTNSKTKQCGIYEVSTYLMAFETGMNEKTVELYLKKFTKYKKIEYDEETGELFILNWLKYNPVSNINIFKCVAEELRWIKSRKLLSTFTKSLDKFEGDWVFEDKSGNKTDFAGACKGLIRGLHTPTKKEEEEKEEEKEEEETKEEEKEKEEEESAAEEKPDEEIIPESQFLCPNSIEFGRIPFFEINKAIKHKPPDIKPPGYPTDRRYIFSERSTCKRELIRKDFMAAYAGSAFTHRYSRSGVNIPP